MVDWEGRWGGGCHADVRPVPVSECGFVTAMDFCSSVSESLSLFQLPRLYFCVGLICFCFVVD